jgi:hypothetical protein
VKERLDAYKTRIGAIWFTCMDDGQVAERLKEARKHLLEEMRVMREEMDNASKEKLAEENRWHSIGCMALEQRMIVVQSAAIAAVC